MSVNNGLVDEYTEFFKRFKKVVLLRDEQCLEVNTTGRYTYTGEDGTLSEDKTKYDIHDTEGFNRDSEELLNQEIELEAKPIDISGLELTAQDIIKIEPFIEVIDDD